MKNWRHYRRLIFNKATLSRVLSEIELEHIRDSLFCNSSISSVLLAGAGKGSQGSEYVFLDAFDSKVTSVFVDINSLRSPDLVADLMCLWPFKNGNFDLVVSTWVLEHIANPEIFLREANRVLQSKGKFVCSVPFLQRKHGSPYDYYRFTDKALYKLLVSAGFKHIQIKPVGGTPFVCCVSLVWPIIRLPFLGVIIYLLARILDGVLRVTAEKMRKASSLFTSYPINYIIVAIK